MKNVSNHVWNSAITRLDKDVRNDVSKAEFYEELRTTVWSGVCSSVMWGLDDLCDQHRRTLNLKRRPRKVV